MPTKASAIRYRETWLNELDAQERAPLHEEETREERDAFIAAQRAMLRRELQALRSLPDNASPEDVRAAVLS